MKRQIYLLIMVMVWGSYSIMAQSVEVTGKITESGVEGGLPGVHVIEEGTKNIAISDINGNYKMSVSSKEAVLVISIIGYTEVIEKLNGRSELNIAMEVDLTKLEEIIVIGYGATTRKELTGAISSVDVEELQKVPVANIAEGLQGRIAGLQVTSADGQPGADIFFKIRGGSSVTAYYSGWFCR